MIAWKHAVDDGKQRTAKQLSRAIAGYESALPDTYGFKAETLRDILNELREKAQQ
jgi:hypothetical protein